MIRISRAGSMRSPVIVVGGLAFKFARESGRASNLYEAKLYRTANATRRALLFFAFDSRPLQPFLCGLFQTFGSRRVVLNGGELQILDYLRIERRKEFALIALGRLTTPPKRLLLFCHQSRSAMGVRSFREKRPIR
jgi:hypothetical protein